MSNICFTLFITITLIFTFSSSFGQNQSSFDDNKKEVISSVDSHEKELIMLSDSIWQYAEVGLNEYKSSDLLADFAEEQGFKVERGVAGIATAFVASFGSGSPVIGIVGEYDALPGLSQKVFSKKEELVPGACGHGCGHNLLGTGSLGAALAIKELIASGKIKGTIKYFGTPAEENAGAKVYMLRDGVFDDLDICFDWHPSIEIKAGVQSTQAIIVCTVQFHGKASHAAVDPWNGRSALDAAESFTHGINMLREHVKPTVRMHYVITDGGKVPNVVPDKASVLIWLRDSKMKSVEILSHRVEQIAKGAAEIADVSYDFKIEDGIHEFLVNRSGAAILQSNLELLGPILYTPEELNFAYSMQEETGVRKDGLNAKINPLEQTKDDPDGGSSDIADVSWVVPDISLSVTTLPVYLPWHSWQVAACSGMSIGHKGMIYAAKALSMTMIDLYENPSLIAQIKKEFSERKGDFIYKPRIPDGLPTKQ